MGANKQIISKKRVADHGEVYTAEREVNAMINMVSQEAERIDSRFLEPACGTGNFLAEILRRKLNSVKERYLKSQIEYDRYSVLAISSIYGIDILQDNTEKCRDRLFEIFNDFYKNIYKTQCSLELEGSVKFILNKNIIWGDALTLKCVNRPDEYITFSEWSVVNGSMIKRRDFRFETMLGVANIKQDHEGMQSLFAFAESDLGEDVFSPKPVREYPVIHYLRISDADNEL